MLIISKVCLLALISTDAHGTHYRCTFACNIAGVSTSNLSFLAALQLCSAAICDTTVQFHVVQTGGPAGDGLTASLLCENASNA